MNKELHPMNIAQIFSALTHDSVLLLSLIPILETMELKILRRRLDKDVQD